MRPESLRWRHNDHAGVSNHQPHGCLLNRLFRRKSKKTSKLRVTGLCAGNSPGTGEFPAQMASYAENVSIWWRLHVLDWLVSEDHLVIDIFRWLLVYKQRLAWWRHQMESNLLVTGPLWGGSTGHRWIPFIRTSEVRWIFGVFFDLRLNKQLNKQSKTRQFETTSLSLWCHCNSTLTLL